MAEPLPRWLLIAVLQSNIALPEALAMRLYHAALSLCRDGGGAVKLAGDLAMGEVRRLGRDMLLGAIAGPGFEADLDTPRGSGRVRFLDTRQALEHAGLAGNDDGERAGEGGRDSDSDLAAALSARLPPGRGLPN